MSTTTTTTTKAKNNLVNYVECEQCKKTITNGMYGSPSLHTCSEVNGTPTLAPMDADVDTVSELKLDSSPPSAS